MSNTGMIKTLDTIQGSSFLIIQSALDVLQNRGVKNLADQKLEVVRDGDSTIVFVTAKDKRRGVRQEAETEMNDAEMQTFTSGKEQAEVIDTIEGSNFSAAEAAVKSFQTHDPDLKHYKITIVSSGQSLIVLFNDKDRPAGSRGSVGAHPGFEVELDADDLKVLRSNFVR